MIFTVCMVVAGCRNKPEFHPSERLTFEKTHLSFITPDKWSRTVMPGGGYPVVYTEVFYDIKPNIQLEFQGKNTQINEEVASFITKKKAMYGDYRIGDESSLVTVSGITGKKITAQRENDKNISIIHIHYVFSQNNEVYILTATCAKPGIGIYEDMFDQAMKSVEIRN